MVFSSSDAITHIIVQSLTYGYNVSSPFVVNMQLTPPDHFTGDQSSEKLKAATTDPTVSKVDAISG